MAPDLFEAVAGTATWFGGDRRELERLFGSPLPRLPPPQVEAGVPRYPVHFHSQLRHRVQRYVKALLKHLECLGRPGPVPDYQAEQDHYTELLTSLVVASRRAERRLGLPNLLWLAHAADVARCVAGVVSRNPNVAACRSLLPGYFAPVLQAVDQAADRVLVDEDAARHAVMLGAENRGLIDALLREAVAFVWLDLGELDLDTFAGAHRQVRLSGPVFVEVLDLVVGEVARRLREREPTLLARASRALPDVDLRADHQATARKVALHSDVLPLVLGDAWTTGRRLAELPRVRSELARRRPAEVLDAFLGMADSLRRFDVVSTLRGRVEPLEGLAGEDAFEEHLRSGRRLYEFSDAAHVVNNAVNATVLFLDLRGFTQTSEGVVSEGGLTRELYAIFDAFAPLVSRFGGSVDKFLGDGMMVTFGTEGEGQGPLAALRTAILCQAEIERLRGEGVTDFQMGVSIHFGRVYVARFIADATRHQLTVIGRNVNLAGRLSSAAKKGDAEESPYRVSVDRHGVLVNEGIALSRAALVQLESEVRLESQEVPGERLLGFDDPEIGGRVLLRYAGDARFKGVEATFPVFEVSHEP